MSHPTVDPNAPLDIKWDPRYEAVLKALNKKMCGVFNKDVILFARALLQLITDGGPVTAREVAQSVYTHDAPRDGWANWDLARWCSHAPSVVAALKSADPMAVFSL